MPTTVKTKAPPTLAPDDLQWLHSGTLRSWLMGPVTTLFALGISLMHLQLAGRWAAAAGLSLSQAWQSYLRGIDPGQRYDGVYLQAMEQFDKSVLSLACAVLVLVIFLEKLRTNRRKARLLAFVTARQQS